MRRRTERCLTAQRPGGHGSPQGRYSQPYCQHPRTTAFSDCLQEANEVYLHPCQWSPSSSSEWASGGQRAGSSDSWSNRRSYRRPVELSVSNCCSNADQAQKDWFAIVSVSPRPGRGRGDWTGLQVLGSHSHPGRWKRIVLRSLWCRCKQVGALVEYTAKGELGLDRRVVCGLYWASSLERRAGRGEIGTTAGF